MLIKKIIFVFLLVFFSLNTNAQKDSVTIKKHLKIKNQKVLKNGNYNPLAPAKAAFYSALFPGMGQIYNRKYWKAPIVWGSLAIPTYYYLTNNREYKRYRKAFKLRTAGLDDEFKGLISNEGLINAQKQLRKNRDLSLFSAVLLYILQIVEASVNAHLLQFNTNDDLSFTPTFVQDPMQFDAPKIGLILKYTF